MERMRMAAARMRRRGLAAAVATMSVAAQQRGRWRELMMRAVRQTAVRALTSWHEASVARSHALSLMVSAASRLVDQRRATGFRRWAVHGAEHVLAIRQLARAGAQLVAWRVAFGWRAWLMFRRARRSISLLGLRKAWRRWEHLAAATRTAWGVLERGAVVLMWRGGLRGRREPRAVAVSAASGMNE